MGKSGTQTNINDEHGLPFPQAVWMGGEFGEIMVLGSVNRCSLSERNEGSEGNEKRKTRKLKLIV